MFRNNMKIAWRNLWNDKFFSLINIVSLAIGLSASFVIGLMVYYDFTFDTFHPDRERIYRVASHFISPDGDFYNSGVAVPLIESLRKDATAVEVVAPFFTTYMGQVKSPLSEEIFKYPAGVIYADPHYFEVFGYTWLAGNPKLALSQPNEVVLVADRAAIYFPDLSPEDMLGAVITYNDSIPAKVVGVVATFESSSDFYFKEIISLPTALQTDMKEVVSQTNWGNTNSATQVFLKLRSEANPEHFQQFLDGLAKEHEDRESAAVGELTEFHLQPMADIHFNNDIGIFENSGMIRSKPLLFSLAAIALFLLLLACINFVNLNTARATQRAKEIGIRKTLGSSKFQLIAQFLSETLMLTVIAALISVALTIWFLQVFKGFIDPAVNLTLFAEPEILLFTVLLLLVVSVLSGFYPALVLTRFNPVSVIKNQVSAGFKKTTLRKSLTVFQFAIAQVFIIATILVGKQIHFMMNRDMGFRSEAIAYIQTPWGDQSVSKRFVFAEEMKSDPKVGKVSLGGNPPASTNVFTIGVEYLKEGQKMHTGLQVLHGDSSFLKVYGIPLLEGRTLRNDTMREVVINETYMETLGITDPAMAVGQNIYIGEDNPIPIVGVMADFHQRSLKSPIKPMALRGDWDRSYYSQFTTVHFSLLPDQSKTWSETIAGIAEKWKRVYPGETFTVRFMDETVAALYHEEQQMAKLLNWATGLSILISCLGLLGLVIYTTERRRKEIGIRKVLGASLWRLNLELSREFILLVGIAFVIAAPIAWWGIATWLMDFAYRTSLSWWVFAVSGLGMLLLALVVMSTRTLVISMTNPVRNLRSE